MRMYDVSYFDGGDWEWRHLLVIAKNKKEIIDFVDKTTPRESRFIPHNLKRKDEDSLTIEVGRHVKFPYVVGS